MTPSEADQPSTSGRPISNFASSWSPSTPPAQEWQSHWQNIIPELEELARSGSSFDLDVFSKAQGSQRSLPCIRRRKRPPDATVMRASQLDAARLDTELAAMLKEQFMKIFSFFQPRLISAFQPELTLILELLVGADCQNVPTLSSKMVGTSTSVP